ncbi:Calcium-independent phospholipase A2-gamma [Tulasnella sp. 427]|nr:Calcium-independent phospholipase A2-gamma [Tulasnella sp. 427]
MWDNPERRSPSERVCRTFVVAIPGCDVPRPAKIFRTYNNRFQRHSADRCQIWEAARATSCAPSFFPEIQVGGVYYSDGGLGYNNPTKLLLKEAQSLWGPNQPIGCLLSIGTGHVDSFMKRFNHPQDLIKFFGVFERMALGCDAVHQEMKNDQLVQPFYYRFNPTMKENVSLDEWKKIRELEGLAWQYLAENGGRVAAFAGAMRGTEY